MRSYKWQEEGQFLSLQPSTSTMEVRVLERASGLGERVYLGEVGRNFERKVKGLKKFGKIRGNLRGLREDLREIVREKW